MVGDVIAASVAGVDGDALFAERKPVLALLIEALVKRRHIAKPAGVNLVP